jgi:hypothetical protein
MVRCGLSGERILQRVGCTGNAIEITEIVISIVAKDLFGNEDFLFEDYRLALEMGNGGGVENKYP